MRHFQDLRTASTSTAQLLNTNFTAMHGKVDSLLKARKDLEKEIQKMRAEQTEKSSQIEELGEIGGIKVQAMNLNGADRKALLPLLDDARAKVDRGVILVTNENKGRGAILLGVTDSLTESHHAGNLLKAILSEAGGRGGGNARTGQGGLDTMDMATIEKLRSDLLGLIQS